MTEAKARGSVPNDCTLRLYDFRTLASNDARLPPVCVCVAEGLELFGSLCLFVFHFV